DAETVSHTLADVLRAPIDLSKLPAATPVSIRELIGRCLERDVKNRLRDIGEARVAIDRALSGKAPVTAPTAKGWSRGAVIAIAGVAAVALAVAAGLAFVHYREQPPVLQPMRFQIAAPAETVLDTTMVVSPDGRTLAFSAVG